MAPASRLLVLACSQRKRSDAGLLPAIERYDGPVFQVLRKYRRENETAEPRTLVLSAKYGLIPEGRPIPHYDEVLSRGRARRIRREVQSALVDHTNGTDPLAEVMVCAGSTYLRALGDLDAVFDPVPVQIVRGTIGKQSALLHDWLWGRPPAVDAEPEERPVVFRGVEISMSADEVRRFARERAKMDPEGASSYRAWCVQIPGRRVAPKWLVSEITGIPVGDFRTSNARRVLTHLGIPVILGDLAGGSKERKDFIDIVRITAELLGGLAALRRRRELRMLVSRPPRLRGEQLYGSHAIRGGRYRHLSPQLRL